MNIWIFNIKFKTIAISKACFGAKAKVCYCKHRQKIKIQIAFPCSCDVLTTGFYSDKIITKDDLVQKTKKKVQKCKRGGGYFIFYYFIIGL